MVTPKTPWFFSSLFALISLCGPENKKESLIKLIPLIQQKRVENPLKKIELQRIQQRRRLALIREETLIREERLFQQKIVKRRLKKLVINVHTIPTREAPELKLLYEDFINIFYPKKPTPSSSPQTTGRRDVIRENVQKLKLKVEAEIGGGGRRDS